MPQKLETQLRYKVDVEQTVNSGQVFLWYRYGNVWYGVNGFDVLSVDVSEPTRVRSFLGARYDLFRQTDNYHTIIRKISKDDVIKNAVRRFLGLRLMRQDPFQCLISFVVSSNSSIQNIRLCLQRVCKKFGQKVIFEGREFYLFPSPQKLSAASVAELASCGLGYRTKFVKDASGAASDGKLDFELLKKSDYNWAKSELLKINGVGNKVADCILLFSLEKLDSFPLDRWVLRALNQYYPASFSFEGRSLSARKYERLHCELVDYFGPFAGYCQQFLFKLVRDSNNKKWL